MKAYHGTQLPTSVCQGEGRLYGNPLRWDYRLANPVAQRFTELLARVRMKALGDRSLAQRLHEIDTRAGRRTPPGYAAAGRGVDAALTDLRARLNAFTIESLRKTLDGARDLPDGKRSDDSSARPGRARAWVQH